MIIVWEKSAKMVTNLYGQWRSGIAAGMVDEIL
jgi:hypothetical protein